MSEPTTAPGLYRRPPKSHPQVKIVQKHTQSFSPVAESVGSNDEDAQLGDRDEERGPIEMELENKSSNIEFQRAQDTPGKAKELKEKKKVSTHVLLHLVAF